MADPGTTQLVVTAIAALGGLGGLGGVLAAVLGRGKLRAESAQIVTASAVQLVNEMQEEAAGARGELRTLRTEVAAMAAELHRIRVAIYDPAATLQSIRLAANAPTGVNGRDPY